MLRYQKHPEFEARCHLTLGRLRQEDGPKFKAAPKLHGKCLSERKEKKERKEGTYNSSTQEAKTGRPRVQGQLQLHSKAKLSLDRLKCKIKTGEMTPWVRMLVEDWDLSPSTHFRQLRTACKSSSRGLDSLFWSLCEPAFTCTYTHREIYIYT